MRRKGFDLDLSKEVSCTGTDFRFILSTLTGILILHEMKAPLTSIGLSHVLGTSISFYLVAIWFITASLSHLRTILPESSSTPLPAKRPHHATQSPFDSKSLYLMDAPKTNQPYNFVSC